MSMIKALRTLAAIENGTLNAAALEAQVAGSQARKDEISQLLAVTSLHARIANSRNAMDALVGSATAWGLVMLHGRVGAFISECAESVSAKMPLYNSDAALNALKASPAAMAALRAASRYSVVSTSPNGGTPVALSLVGAAHILLGVSCSQSGAAYTHTLSTRRSGSAVSATVSTDVTGDVLAKDVDVALPLAAPYSFTSTSTGGVSIYFGVLRCDA